MPRPKIVPTPEDRKLALTLSAYGVPQEEIAKRIGIRSPKTLRKHYREELDRGSLDANCKVVQDLEDHAIDGEGAYQRDWRLVDPAPEASEAAVQPENGP